MVCNLPVTLAALVRVINPPRDPNRPRSTVLSKMSSAEWYVSGQSGQTDRTDESTSTHHVGEGSRAADGQSSASSNDADVVGETAKKGVGVESEMAEADCRGRKGVPLENVTGDADLASTGENTSRA